MEVVDSVEDGGVLLQEAAKGLGESLGLAISDLTETTGLVCGQMPVDLVNLARGELGNAGGTHSVFTSAATFHVSEHEALGSRWLLRGFGGRRRREHGCGCCDLGGKGSLTEGDDGGVLRQEAGSMPGHGDGEGDMSGGDSTAKRRRGEVELVSQADKNEGSEMDK